MGCLDTSFTLIISAAIFTLAQGILWTIFSILCLLLYRCKISVSNNGQPSYLIYLVYFFNKDCGTPPEFITQLQWGWPTEPVEPAQRTLALAISYLICNILWSISSATLAIAVYRNRKEYTQTPWYVYFAWIFCTILVLINDLVATSLYGYDFIETSSIGDLMRLIGVQNLGRDWISLVPIGYRRSPAAATAVMMVMSCKLLVLWVANVLLVIFIVRAARRGELARRKDIVNLNRDIIRSQQLLPGPNTSVDGGTKGTRTEDKEMQQLSGEREEDVSLVPLRMDQEEDDASKEPEVDTRKLASEDTSSPKPERSVVSRLSEAPAPEDLRNQLPWRYPQLSSSDVARLSKRSSNGDKFTSFNKPARDAISETSEET